MQYNQDNQFNISTCAQACLDCYMACTHCAHECLRHEPLEMMRECITRCLDCIDLCKICAGFVQRQSPLAKEVCNVCADACDRCVEE